MANRRKKAPAESVSAPREKAAKKAGGTGKKTHGEVFAVILACLGIITLLSLVSYDARDTSLNASGRAAVANWIGPAGAYWADLMLQLVGIGAYALGLGCVLAGWRALVGRRVRPGAREAIGVALLVVSSGTLAHLILASVHRTYPAGGVAGALLGSYLLAHFAQLGAYIMSGTFVVLSLALSADGVLHGLGMRGASAAAEASSHVKSWWALIAERLKSRRLGTLEPVPALAGGGDESVISNPWGWDEEDEAKELARKERREKRVESARQRGQELGAADAVVKREKAEKAEKVERKPRRGTEPQVAIDDTIDLFAEEEFVPQRGATLDIVDADDEPEMPEPEIRAAEAPFRGIDKPVAELAPRKEKRAPLPKPPAALVEAPIDESDLPPLQATRMLPPDPEPAPAPVTAAALAVEKPKREKKPKLGEPEIVDVRPDLDAASIIQASAAVVEEDAKPKTLELPPVSLLDYVQGERAVIDPEKLRENAQRLVKTLKEYGIEGSVREIRPGPVVTMYEYVPAPGIKISKIAGLADDLAMSMAALRVRIVAPIPGKGAVGIEIPNEVRETVYLKEIVAHDAFKKSGGGLTMALGKDIEGNAYAANLAKMPHLLVAGATGTGKSVSINAMIMSILFKATPEEVRMIMVDPKMLELSVYEGIPHLLLPVVTDPKKAALALRWAVEEMERRYEILSSTGVRNIDGYNEKLAAAKENGKPLIIPAKKEGEEDRVCESMPYIVVIVDELADLMMVASREVEGSIMRLAQMARAAGIHLILATQRPSVDVLTGVIKANFPTRIAFQVASKHDSRTIIDGNGAEHLLGRGDMLYLSPGVGGIKRVHGAFVSDQEVERTVAFWKEQAKPQYDESILAPRPEDNAEGGGEGPDNIKDEMYDQAVAIVAETRQASISMIQRRLRIGYNRAARMVELMETEGIVGPADGAKPREVLVNAI